MSVLAMRRSAAMALVLATALPAGAAEEEALTLLRRERRLHPGTHRDCNAAAAEEEVRVRHHQ